MPLGGLISDRLTRRYGPQFGRRIVPMVGLGLKVNGLAKVSAKPVKRNTAAHSSAEEVRLGRGVQARPRD
jgi:hypothetical protein